jgi:hypothetical protein
MFTSRAHPVKIFLSGPSKIGKHNRRKTKKNFTTTIDSLIILLKIFGLTNNDVNKQ